MIFIFRDAYIIQGVIETVNLRKKMHLIRSTTTIQN